MMDMSEGVTGVASKTRGEAQEAPAVRIWDLPVRLFHWLLVLTVAVASITGWLLPPTWLQLHLIAGTAIAALVLFRLVWGFTGTAYSRFSSFVFPPSVVLKHVEDLSEGRAGREAGHNPLGALNVFALLAVLAGIVLTGTLALGGALKQGPFKSFLGFDAGWLSRDFHSFLAVALLVLIGGHLAGVIFESVRTDENLATSMVIGTKREGFAHGLKSQKARPFTALVVVVGVAALTFYAITSLDQRPPAGVPHLAVDQSWAKECSACHIAFHPSLLPAASWAGIMDNLANHFGEDASLNAATTASIKAFLVANAAEQWDTLPARRLQMIDPARPLEITASRFWIRMHDFISPAVFASKAVKAKQNCQACHADAASGMFAPQEISIPEESEQ
jgi:cytochrome b